MSAHVGDLLRASADAHPEVVAVDAGAGGRRSFAQLAERALRLAAGLAAAGVAPGARVGVVARNRVEYVELYFALAELGAVIVPLNWRLRPNELRAIARDAEMTALVAEEAFLAAFEGPAAGSLALRACLDGPRPGWRGFEQLLAAAPLARRAESRADDVVVQMYTSGTTGAPKGAMLTHANVLAMTAAWLEDMPLAAARSRFLQVTPLFHVGALLMVLSTVSAGCTLRLLAEFLPGPALDAIESERVTHALFVPAMVQWLLAEPGVEERDLSSLELIVYGAAPMPGPTLQRALERFGCRFLQGYGLTETAGVLTTLTAADHEHDRAAPPPRRLASAGRAASCCEVRVVDAAGASVAPGEVGEIVARGENVTPGYWRRPEATADALRGGWFHTGDLATVDEDGYVYVVDRLKDMICVAGENVYPREVELALNEHTEVADCAVIGIPHELWGEEVLALIVPRPDAAASEREWIRHCRERLARFKCPTRVERVAAIPRNAAGKVLKRELREPWWEGRERRV